MITKQQLGNTLWGMAEILYDKVEDYKTYILSLLFFKRLSDNWTWEIDNKIREHVATYGKQPNEKQRVNGRVFVRDSHTKWGNCSSQGNISLNWHLILVPPTSAHYVALHELLHTHTPNHSKAFWSRMRSYMPNYRDAVKKLDKYLPGKG